MPAFKYELLDDGLDVYAVTFNDIVVWLRDNDDAPIWKELLLEANPHRQFTLLPDGEFTAKCKQALGVV